MARKNEPPDAAGRHTYEPLTAEEFKRLAAEAQLKGESTTPLVKRLVLTTIDEVAERLTEVDDSDRED